MNKIVVNGGRPLFGEVRVSGSKNAALPLIFATMLTEGISILQNVPRIGDVFVALDILSEIGAKISFEENRLIINTESLKYSSPNHDLTSKIRASTYLIGASLARFGRFELADFGGCSFSLRPIDLHIKSAISLGAKMVDNTLLAEGLVGTEIRLEKPSVGATINTLIMASAASGTTEIYGFAKEPHVFSLIEYLGSIGADVTVTDEKITVKESCLSPTEFSVIGDMIEAGTYIIFAIVTGGEIRVSGFNTCELSSLFSVLSDMGYSLFVGDDFIIAKGEKERKLEQEYPHIIADPYPGFPTDLQPIIAPLLAMNDGGVITDNVWPGRFGYLESLSNFGLKFSWQNSSVKIEKSTFQSGSSVCPDLRGGAACLIAALASDGRSDIHSPEIILRGYEKIIEKLESLGADVKLVKM